MPPSSHLYYDFLECLRTKCCGKCIYLRQRKDDRENYLVRKAVVCNVLVTKFYSGDQIEARVETRMHTSSFSRKTWRYEGKESFERHRRRWKYNIKMNLKDIRWEDVDCIGRLKIGSSCGSYEHGKEPLGRMRVGKFLDRLSDYHILRKNCAIWN
jgi:hypothetical protein